MSTSNQSSTVHSGARMPSIFVGHGAPLLAVDAEKGAPLVEWGTVLAREFKTPRAVLSISAHWTTAGDTLSLGPLTPQPLIYDFSGFPEELYRVKYPAPGGEVISKEVSACLAKLPGVSVKETERGLDHGTWTPLVHLWPKADVPILQLSLPMSWSGKRWFELGQALAPLRDAGVLIMGSGNVTHNLRKVDWRPNAEVPQWAAEFDSWLEQNLTRFHADELMDYKQRAPALATNHPTEEHWAPLVVVAGAAGQGPKVSYPVSGWEFGSLSRRSVQFS
ncbi:MAG: dioxygenase [Polyangiaceae bacterium]|nr:dioxygenase [Polyangiaceae bacterium]